MPGYVVALFLLLLNDHVLKPAFPGFVTGKLSDFAGVFAFAAFFASAIPRRAATICAATGALFVWWKSPLSQTVVDALGLSRVVDWTDLAALIVLPFAYRLAVRKPIVWHPALVCVSLFAFAATSVPRASFDIPNDHPLARIETKMPIEVVLERLSQCGLEPQIYRNSLNLNHESQVLSPRKHVSASADFHTEADGIVIELRTVFVWRPGPYIDERAVRDELAQHLDACLHK